MKIRYATLTWLEKYFLKRTLRKVTLQGRHQERIEDFMLIFYKEIWNEFTEDNKPTLDNFIDECHKNTIKRYWDEQ